MASPPSASSDRLEPEEEAEADSAEVAAQAAAQTLENRKLRRELESLRALAQWQQSEVGAVLACRPGDLTRPHEEPPVSQGQQVAGSSRPRGSLVMAALAGEALLERAERDGALQAPAGEGMDGTGRPSGWRPESCGQDAATLHFRQQGLRNGIQERPVQFPNMPRLPSLPQRLLHYTLHMPITCRFCFRHVNQFRQRKLQSGSQW
ncbi:unnamed protein product [Symbiodinium necroappetens]|uniref:Uncharacterized protein n=1 Tax=Symbiodinium necroappetens TaxID=1628268 RepID=A0A813C5Z3_9DINO|nr:unnamed protein product [Symbiodinium necroappetens]